MPSNFRFTVLLVLCFFAFSLTIISCQKEVVEKKFRIGFSQCCDDAWRDVMNREMHRELLLHPELSLDIRVANNDNKYQIKQIQELVASGIDILLVSPNETQPLTSVLEEIYKTGIPVVLIDRKIESELYTTYIGADNYEVGATAGQYIISRFPKQAKIIEIQLSTKISPARERSRGFRDAIKSAVQAEIIEVLEVEKGLGAITDSFPDILRRHPDANVIFGHTDQFAEYAYRFAKDAGRADTTFFLGIDGIPGTGRGIQAVEDGILNASMLYPTGGAEAIRLALAILNELPFDKENKLETIVINSDNASILHNQMKKISSLQKSIDQQVDSLQSLESIYRNQRIYIFILISSLLLLLLLGAFLWRSLKAKQAAFKILESKNYEIQQNENQLRQISSELELATRAKVDFFTNISHEFRTPLSLVMGFTEDLLNKKELKPDMVQSIFHIHQNAHRLLRLVNQLMDFRKMDSQQMKLRASEQDIVEFTQQIMASFHRMAQKRQINFQLRSQQNKILCWFDPSMIDKVLFNLLSNAFKFTNDHGQIQLTISIDEFKQNITLSVEDSGKGMSSEEVEHVFEPFFQGKEQRLPGTGLGLSLSKSLVELHHGNIQVQSTIGQGSRFLVSLPLGSAHLTPEQLILENQNYVSEQVLLPDPELSLSATNIASSPEDPTLQNVLCIEDNVDLQLFLKRQLATRYNVYQTVDGKEGLQQAIAQTPDLIICDINLPSMDGLQITKQLKADMRTSHIPIILLSSLSSIDQQTKGIESGADAYLTKPFNVEFLLAQIKSLLLNRQVLKSNLESLHTFHTLSSLNIELPDSLSNLDRVFIEQFSNYAAANYARQDFQVADLCEEMKLSRSQLYRKVKALMGESVSSYVEKIRLKSAEQLLQESKISVANIAYQVGYSSPDYFSTVFKSKYNMTPSQYRKKHN